MIAINQEKFFASIRDSIFHGSLNQKQVDGVNAILAEWQKRELTDLHWLSYILATAYHETAHTMQPIEEYGRGKGKPYGIADKETGKIYYGRGFSMITWLGNYQKFERLLNVPLVHSPELALQLDIATQILFEGMIKGLFTGKKLADFFTGDKTDWINARRIVNILDCAELIGNYGKQFYAALI